MNQIIKNRFEMFVGVNLFAGKPGLPVNARATALFALNQTVVTNMTNAGAAQEEGRGVFQGATADRVRLGKELRAIVRMSTGIAKVLDPVAFPAVRQQVRGPRSTSYMALIASAIAIKAAVTPAAVKAAFVDRGIAADFDTELEDLAESLQEATALKGLGRSTRVGGTVGLLAESRRGLAIVRELAAIMEVILANNPVLLSEWNSISRVQRPPAREPEGSSPVSGTGAGLSPTTGN